METISWCPHYPTHAHNHITKVMWRLSTTVLTLHGQSTGIAQQTRMTCVFSILYIKPIWLGTSKLVSDVKVECCFVKPKPACF